MLSCLLVMDETEEGKEQSSFLGLVGWMVVFDCRGLAEALQQREQLQQVFVELLENWAWRVLNLYHSVDGSQCCARALQQWQLGRMGWKLSRRGSLEMERETLSRPKLLGLVLLLGPGWTR